MDHLELVADIAQRWSEVADVHTKLELLLELRERSGAQGEVEVFDILFSIILYENDAITESQSEAMRWFNMWKAKVAPPNARDRSHLLKR
jgi:hypothetical protein